MKFTVTRGAPAEYRDENGRQYFSVSQHITVLDPNAFVGVSPHVLAAAGMRGEQLHVYFALMVLSLNGLAAWPDRPLGPMAKTFDSIVRWVEKRRPRVMPMLPPETSVGDARLRMAGTPDLPCFLDDDISIVDLKNGVRRAVHSAQLHAYKKICGLSHARLFSLYSRPDGKMADLVDHTKDHVDWSAVMAANAVLNWRMMRHI